jgi:hypothetical protein
LLAQAARQFVAVEVGQADVEQADFRHEGLGQLERVGGRVGDFDLVSGRVQEQLQGVHGVDVVVHQQDAQRAAPSGRRSPAGCGASATSWV